MRLLRSFPRLAFALVLISIAGLCIAQQSVWLLLGAGAIAVASRTVTEGPRGRAIPRVVAAGLFAALAVYAIVAIVREGVPWIVVLGHFALGMTLIKLYERRTPRDYGHLLVLSLLMIIIGCVQISDLLFGVVVIVYAGLGLHVLLLFQLYASHERAKAERLARSPRGYRLVPPVKPAARRRVVSHLHALGMLIAVAGLVVSAIVFIVLPRDVGRDVVRGLRMSSTRARAGFSDRIDLQTGRRITSRRRPVMDLRFDGPVPEWPLRLRGAVLDTYSGEGRWRTAPVDTRLVQTRPPTLTPLAGGPFARTVTFTVDPFERQSVLFSPLRPVAVTTAEQEPLRFNPVTATLRRPGAASRVVYTVRAALTPGDGADVTLPPAPAGDLSALLDPQVRTLAGRALDAAGVPRDKPADGTPERDRWNAAAAEAFSLHLQGGTYSYTTDLSDVVLDGRAGADPIGQFLFETRRGHCEYFASAHAALCANAGVPVRLVTGYVAYETDPDRSIVIEANAHAWTEVRTGPGRWETFDPTPPGTLRTLHRMQPSVADRLSWVYERMESSWRAGVVLFDGRTQRRLRESLDVRWGERVLGAYRAAVAWAERVNRAFRLGPAGYIWLSVVAFALLLAVLATIRFLRRAAAVRRALRLERGHGVARRMVRQLGFYLDMLQLLERAGMGKPPWRPPRQHALVLEQDGHAAGRLVRDLTDRYYAARYGQTPLSRRQLVETAGLLDELARGLGVRR